MERNSGVSSVDFVVGFIDDSGVDRRLEILYQHGNGA